VLVPGLGSKFYALETELAVNVVRYSLDWNFLGCARVIPHRDGAGRVDQLGAGVPFEWMGRSVWCHGAQSCRPFGTAAEFTVFPVDQVARLPESVPMEQGACMGLRKNRALEGVFGHGRKNAVRGSAS
jgi:NADPH:quinone reductase-like Zn-dependent oxidoreductase